jgi:phosphonate degradation associated HDIG domain protein
MNACEFLFETLAIHGGTPYGPEPVSQLEHALQCAALAQEEGAPPQMIVAALLHDIGHLIYGYERTACKREADDRHEVKGAAILGRWFGADVTEPIRLHVPAKRYLCATDPDYYESLSTGSKRSLALQGDAFDRDSADNFFGLPGAQEAVFLRRWDDRAKVPDLNVPRLDYYRRHIDALVEEHWDSEKLAV